MTNPKDAGRYPTEYIEMLELINDDPTLEVEIPCEDSKQQFGLMKKLYDFRQALVNDPTWDRLHPIANRMMLRRRDGMLIVSNRDNSPEAKLVRNAVEQAKRAKEE